MNAFEIFSFTSALRLRTNYNFVKKQFFFNMGYKKYYIRNTVSRTMFAV